MESTFSKNFFVPANNDRMQDFMKREKKGYNEIVCNENNCSVETFLNILDEFILNDELTYDERRVKFIDVCSRFASVLNTFFIIQQNERSKKLVELLLKKKELQQEISDVSKDIFY